MTQDRLPLLLGLLIFIVNIVTGVLLAARLIGINRFVGWRTQATLKSPQMWFDMNAKLGWGLLVAGCLGVALYAALEFYVTGLKQELKGILLLSAVGVASIVATAIVGLIAS